MTEQDKIYTAVVLDTGSFFELRKTKSSYTAHIRIRRKDKAMITEINKNFGGYVAWSAKDDAYSLHFVGHRCTELLKIVLPYMKTKIEHAQILMEFQSAVKERMKAGHSRKLTDTERQERQMLLDRIKNLSQ